MISVRRRAAKSIGMNHFKTMLYVILPQTIRNIIPQIGNNHYNQHQGYFRHVRYSYAELFAAHKAIVGAKYVYFPSAVITLTIYLIMTVICSLILRLWEKKLDGPENFDLSTTDSLAHTSGMYTFVKKTKKKEER